MSVVYDISVPLHNRLVSWPGDPGLIIEYPMRLENGDPATVSRLVMGSHTGTHVDAFCHFKTHGRALHQMDLSVYVGKALVLEINDAACVTRTELENHPLKAELVQAKRVLFSTANSRQAWAEQPFNEHFCHIHPDAASYLAGLGVQLVGIDYLSVEGFHAERLYGESAPTHHRLMDAGVYIVEGLYFQNIPEGWYDLTCLPLAIEGGDGAPARVILRPLGEAS